MKRPEGQAAGFCKDAIEIKVELMMMPWCSYWPAAAAAAAFVGPDVSTLTIEGAQKSGCLFDEWTFHSAD